MIHKLFAQEGELTEAVSRGIDGLYQPTGDLETTIAGWSVKIVLGASLALIVLILIAMNTKHINALKTPLFIMITLTITLPTFFLLGSTIYLNTSADSGGPVHWHADVEYWACGNELELRNPFGTLSNKIGTAVLHEHNDKRIHLEGVVVDDEVDATLGKFMSVIGGAVTDNALVVPIDSESPFEDEVDGDGENNLYADQIEDYLGEDENDVGYARFVDGEKCGDQEADVQVFVYQYDGDTKTYEQFKLDNPRDYVITEDPNVPPGDCIIFEFDVTKSKTDKLCEQYGVRDIERCEEFGVEESKREICELTQTNYDKNVDYREGATEIYQPEINEEQVQGVQEYFEDRVPETSVIEGVQ